MCLFLRSHVEDKVPLFGSILCHSALFIMESGQWRNVFMAYLCQYNISDEINQNTTINDPLSLRKNYNVNYML